MSEGLFFLERKNQRTFDRSPGVVRGEQLLASHRVRGTRRSLFASFSSEKEETLNS
jgi:hypothetical protein